MMVSSPFGWACVAIALPENRPLTNGLIDPAPSKASVVPSPTPNNDKQEGGDILHSEGMAGRMNVV